jgi:hypothetical protein
VGLQFARTDLMRIEQAIRGLDAHAERAFGVSVIEAELARRSLDDAELGDDVRKAFDAGRARWGVLSRQEIASAAWAEVNRRLALLLRGHEQSVASLEELLCAVVPTGPAKVLGLDFEATTLANWTSALAIAARITTNPVAKSREVPPWVIGHALNRLGSPTLDVADLRTLVRALLPAGAAPDPAEPEAIAEIVRTAGTARSSERPSAGRSRLALCVVGPDEGASMRSWTQPPRSGLALIVTQEQFALLAGKGLLNALRVPMVVAVGQDRLSGEPGTKTLNESVPRLLGKDGQAVVWVYPRREPGMRKPFVIDPQSPDEVLEYAQPPRSAPA